MTRFLLALTIALTIASATTHAQSEPFVGEISWFAGNFAPRGWAFCDGQLLPISGNAALFSILGTTYGGDGRTTVGLPNVQGRTLIHPGNGPGLTTRSLGESGGEETHTLSMLEMPVHNHLFRGIASLGDVNAPSGMSIANGADFYRADEPNIAMHPQSIGNTGGGQAHNNMQPYNTLQCIIALTGLFPSRS